MTRALYTSASAIRSSQAKLDVISNNIANVNTVGFKSSNMNFSTVFSNTISGGTSPNGTLGGTNPMQIGNGVRISDIQANFGQGGTKFTGRTLDMMIDGQGFFAVERIDQNLGTVSSSFYLTRAGNFSLDSAGNLVTAAGNRVRGTSQLQGTNPLTLETVLIPQELIIAKDLDNNGNPVATHFAAAGTATAAVQAANTTLNAQNIATVSLVNFTVGSDGAILATYSNGDRITVRTDPNTIDPTDATLARREIIHLTTEGQTFGPDNSSPGNGPPDGNPSTATDTGVLDQVAGFEVFTSSGGGNGMEGMQMQLQLATVTNPGGLLYDGGNNFLVGANAGTTNFGAASIGGRGGLSTGALETSNVDLATEFSEMIVTQRGLEAATRMITAESQVLQAIINSV